MSAAITDRTPIKPRINLWASSWRCESVELDGERIWALGTTPRDAYHNWFMEIIDSIFPEEAA